MKTSFVALLAFASIVAQARPQTSDPDGDASLEKAAKDLESCADACADTVNKNKKTAKPFKEWTDLCGEDSETLALVRAMAECVKASTLQTCKDLRTTDDTEDAIEGLSDLCEAKGVTTQKDSTPGPTETEDSTEPDPTGTDDGNDNPEQTDIPDDEDNNDNTTAPTGTSTTSKTGTTSATTSTITSTITSTQAGNATTTTSTSTFRTTTTTASTTSSINAAAAGVQVGSLGIMGALMMGALAWL